MADVRPFDAVHYDPEAVGSIEAVLAPPYDVIDDTMRGELLAGSAHNVVEIDLPLPAEGLDRYQCAAETLHRRLDQGILVADPEPSIWALTQSYLGPDGARRDRNAILARVRVEDYGAGRIRAHERTQPGPKQDRLDLTRATGYNLSPIFTLTSVDAWPAVVGALADAPWAQAGDPDGTVTRIWRLGDPGLHERVSEILAGAELLIADGHHRYETARAYAEEVGGDGPHRYTLMALTGLDDPGLTVFPTHRLLTGLDREASEQLEHRLAQAFTVEEIGQADLDPTGIAGPGVIGYVNRHTGRTLRLRLEDTSALDRSLAERSAAYRSLDSVVLECLVLKDMLGMSEKDIADKRGIGYSKSIADAEIQLAREEFDAAFILRPTPIEDVRAVAGAGEIMPPKSTYFYPKLPTGIAFNPVGPAARTDGRSSP